MDRFKKRILKEFDDMERHMGRMMRNMAVPRMVPLQSGAWVLAADIYETEKEIILCMDVMGIAPESLDLFVEQRTVTISGERNFPISEPIICVHHLEIERGRFERTIQLPLEIDPSAVTSECRNGFLLLRLPKRQVHSKGVTRIKIE